MGKLGEFFKGMLGGASSAAEGIVSGAKATVASAKGTYERSSPAYVARIKGLAARGKSAYAAGKASINSKLDAAEAEMDEFDRRALASDRKRRARLGLGTDSEISAEDDGMRQQVANHLAGIYWLRKAECAVSGKPLVTKDLYFDSDEPMNKLIDEAIRAQEPAPETPIDQLEAGLAAAEADLPLNDAEPKK